MRLQTVSAMLPAIFGSALLALIASANFISSASPISRSKTQKSTRKYDVDLMCFLSVKGEKCSWNMQIDT